MAVGRNLPILPALLVLAVTLVLVLAGCSPSEHTTVSLSGSSTIAPLAQVLGEAFEMEHDGARVNVQTGGSSRGISDVTAGLVDIGMVSRQLGTGEDHLRAYTIAWDGIAPIVHRSNPVGELSDEQVAAIYTGRINDWAEVGGQPSQIVVVNKAEGRSTLALFLDYFGLENSEIDADVVIGDNQQGIKTVAGNPNAIGYVSIGAAEFEAGAGQPIRLLPMAGVEASTANVLAGRFPLSRPLNLVIARPPEGKVRDFIEYARSPAAHEAVRGQFFVPVTRYAD